MALMHTPAVAENFIAPSFELKGTEGKIWSLEEIKGEKGFVIAFICNHCPYVIAVKERLAQTFTTLQNEGFGCAAIMANDTEEYPADSYENMITFAKDNGFTFPYLIDETQETAKAYDAVCTPDFFGFDKHGTLKYRGRLDSAANKEADENTIPELLEAMRRIAEVGAGPHQQNPSMGCSIKWK